MGLRDFSVGLESYMCLPQFPYVGQMYSGGCFFGWVEGATEPEQTLTG